MIGSDKAQIIRSAWDCAVFFYLCEAFNGCCMFRSVWAANKLKLEKLKVWFCSMCFPSIPKALGLISRTTDPNKIKAPARLRTTTFNCLEVGKCKISDWHTGSWLPLSCCFSHMFEEIDSVGSFVRNKFHSWALISMIPW